MELNSFDDDYTDDEADETDKKLISTDAFAVGSMLDKLSNQIKQLEFAFRK